MKTVMFFSIFTNLHNTKSIGSRRRRSHSGRHGTQKCHQVEKKLISLRPGLISWSNASDRWHFVLCLSLYSLWSILREKKKKKLSVVCSTFLPSRHSWVVPMLEEWVIWFCHKSKAVDVWVTAVSNATNRSGLGGADERWKFFFLAFLCMSVLFYS